MSERWRFRFSLRTTMVAVTLFCAALWWLVAHPRAIQQRQTVTGRQQIHQRDRLFLEACVDQSVREHLVTVLGDSRLSHWGSVRWLFGPDRDTIISHGNDGALIVWNRDDGSIREGFFDVPFAARAVDAGLIFMGDSKGNVRIWSVADKSFRDVQWQLPVLQNPTCTATPDGAYFVFGTYGGELTVWDAESGLRLNVIDLKADAQEGYEYEFHGPILGTKNHHLVAAAPKYLAEFDLMSGERLALVAIPATDDGGSASIFDLQLSDDEKKLFVGDAAGRVMAFDWEEHRYLEQVFYGATSISDFSFSADGRDLRVVRDGDVLGLEFWTNGQVITRSVYVGEVSALGDPSHFLMGTRSGRIVVLSGDDEARLKGGPRGDAVRFAYSPRGDRIALAGRDGRIVIRETATWTQRNSWSAHHGAISHVEWSRDGENLISFGADRVAAVWDPNTGSEVAVLKAFTSPNRAPTFDPTGRWLALQNLTRESLITLYDVKTWTETQSLPKDAFRPRGPVLFSLDGTKLIAGGSKVAQVWDLESRKVTATIGGRSLDDVKLALSPDGKVLYSLMSRIVEAFDIATSASLWTTKLNATQSYSIATHPTQPLLVVGDNEGAAILLNAATGKVLMQLRIGPTRGEVEQVEFSPDGKLLTAAMSNGAVVVMRTPALR